MKRWESVGGRELVLYVDVDGLLFFISINDMSTSGMMGGGYF